MPESKSRIVEVDPNGDVILELSEGTKLLVSSRVLELSSKVFAKMLTSQFKEGQGGGSLSMNPRIIKLPDEDVEAFVLLSNAIHYRMDLIPRKPAIACLENLAILCDKWDFTRALASMSELWLQTWIASTSDRDLNKLLFIAYVQDAPDAFSKVSWEILITHFGLSFNLPAANEHGLMADHMLVDFRARKAELVLEVLKAMESPISELFNCSSFPRHAGDYFKWLRRYTMWPLVKYCQENSIVAISQQISNMTEPVTESCGYAASHNFKGKLEQAIGKVLSVKSGLCLDCVKTGGKSRLENACRVCMLRMGF